MARKRHPGRPFAIVLLLLGAIALFSVLRDRYNPNTIQRRSLAQYSAAREEPACRLVHEAADQCAFVREYCDDEDAGLLSYLQLYYCRLPNAKPLGFIIIALWTALLFTTIGVAASDFFCINLSTISGILGMSESMAGVTFLAFGNGSPDVFSTFAAMKTNSGSLAVGELIGAASFIAAVVAASMALVRPFKVAKKSFVRDVSFFIVAVSFSMFFLANGKLELWECIVMVAFYIFYVVVVVVWHWYLSQRRRRREARLAATSHFIIPGDDEIETEEQYHDDPDDVETSSRPSRSRVVSVDDLRDLERANFETRRDSLDDLDEQAERHRWMGDLSANMRVTRPPGRTRSSTMTPIRPSLVGALEFQSVLASLQKSRNIHDTPINLRRYSDDLAFTVGQQKRAYSTTSDPEVESDFEGELPHTAGADLPNGHSQLSSTGKIAGRARAVSASGAAGLNIDRTRLPLLNTGEPSQPRPLLSPVMSLSPPGSEGVSSPAPGRSRASTGADLLEIPGQQYGHQRLPSPSPHFTESPRAMSPMLRPQLKLSLPGSIHDGSSHSSVEGDYHDDVLEAPISARPTTLRQASGGTIRDSLYPIATNESQEATKPLKWWPYHLLPPPHVIMGTLFPTLTHFRKKGLFDKLLGICTAPCFFLLTITLPVVEPAADDEIDDGAHPHHSYHSGYGNAASEAVSIEERHHHHDRAPIIIEPREDAGDESAVLVEEPNAVEPAQGLASNAKYWNRWLVLVHSFTSPWLVILVVWANFDDATWSGLGWAALWSLLGSTVFVAFVLLTTTATRPPKWQFALCFVGFAVSIAWISTIANEVVGVLKAIGVVFNISDAILGLTIFAVGNSLGDLVADVTVARLGYPVMALSACFGGPLLNILLGIGLSGGYMVITGESKYHKKHPHKHPRFKPYQIEVSWTLLISAIGLLVTLVALLVLVPLNKWRMDRRIGGLLVVIWVAATATNIAVEMTGVADKWVSLGSG